MMFAGCGYAVECMDARERRPNKMQCMSRERRPTWVLGLSRV